MATNNRVIPVPPPDGFEWRDTPAGPALVCRALEPLAAHLFTTRQWPLGLAEGGDRTSAWADVASALGVDAAHLQRAHQVHGASVVVRRAGDPPRGDGPLPHADIIVSDDPAIVLSIQAADCVPLLIADRRTGAIAAAHAGWRGMVARVPEVAVQALSREFGSRAADLVAAIGPSISAPRYEVGDEVRDRFKDAGCPPPQVARWFVPAERPGHWYFDGWASARDQLEASGVPADRIHLAGLCTASHPDLLCSYRRDGKAAGRIAGAIRTSPRRP
jgi:purine-nucleoside/S-methyl-5'-thioadenosine phosphorylase / adenosine deaminase